MPEGYEFASPDLALHDGGLLSARLLTDGKAAGDRDVSVIFQFGKKATQPRHQDEKGGVPKLGQEGGHEEDQACSLKDNYSDDAANSWPGAVPSPDGKEALDGKAGCVDRWDSQFWDPLDNVTWPLLATTAWWKRAP